MKRLLLGLIFISQIALAQNTDTVRVMQYNILQYGNNTSGCSNTSAAMAAKDADLKKIVKSTNPDILAVNEMASNVLYAERILQNVLNTDGVSAYRRGLYSNFAGSPIVNMIFYNSDLFAKDYDEVITTTLRDINLTRLYYKDSIANSNGDTVFLVIINGHLKAGSNTSDQNTRANMIQEVLTVLSVKGVRDNYLILGDFNSRSSSEPAIQNLLNPSDPKVKFLDPINSLGFWNNSSNFAGIHTQSTHISGGCHAGGGMDDRFDVIFASEYIMGDSAGVKYIPGTYTAYGQDGNHFNQSINFGGNSAVPDSIADALYNMSDHLPVFLDLEIEMSTISSFSSIFGSEEVRILHHPVGENINLSLDVKNEYLIRVCNLHGQTLLEKEIAHTNRVTIPLESGPGIYLLEWQNQASESGRIKILKR